MIVYPPIFYCTELKPAFKGKLTFKVADTLHLKASRYRCFAKRPCCCANDDTEFVYD